MPFLVPKAQPIYPRVYPPSITTFWGRKKIWKGSSDICRTLFLKEKFYWIGKGGTSVSLWQKIEVGNKVALKLKVLVSQKICPMI